METTNIVDFTRRDGMSDALTELLKTGAQQLIATAVEAEFVSYLAQFAGLRTEEGHAAVVRNGHHPARPLQTGIGLVSVRIGIVARTPAVLLDTQLANDLDIPDAAQIQRFPPPQV